MAIDLHTHSTASDGTLAPAEVVRQAKACGLSALALTDHDTTDSFAGATEEAARLGIELVPGIEINTDAGQGELHFLGYLIRPADPGLRAVLARVREQRLARTRAILSRLREAGISVEEAAVLRAANGATICRPHIARALVEAGYAESVPDAFQRYLSRRSPFYVPRAGLTAQEAISVICRAGGVPVLSHPGRLPEEAVLALLPMGLRGIEAYHPEHSDEVAARWHALAERKGLVATGGSDYHGPRSVHPEWGLGAVRAPAEVLAGLRRAQEDLTRFE